MNVEYIIDEKRITWKNTSLTRLLKECIPTGWEELFEAAEEILPGVSEKLREYAKKNVVYPPIQFVFNSFDSLRPRDIKIVIIGMDPYINKGEAMGWSFSVPDGIKVPPSLRNIYKELDNEGFVGYKQRKTGELTEWVKRGVFLYNVCLTVNSGKSGSHGNLWDEFTNMLINYLNEQGGIAWILLGKKAEMVAKQLDKDTHGIFIAGHPSPLNRNGNFIGSNVFKKAQKYLHAQGKEFTWDL